ncbi:MAG: GAF domain-containing protein [Deferrisomatales bacterium]|nr:GAF domain-containing protein [Deferrisomatales bacterium]
MVSFAYSSLRTRITLLVLLALLPALALIAWNGVSMRRLSRESAHQEALRVARTARDQQAALVEAAHHVLAAVSLVPAVSRPESAQCQELVGSVVSRFPQFAALLVFQPDGTVACAPGGLREPVNLADRSMFQEALQNGRFAVGEYLIWRVTGEAVLPFGFPVLDESGNASLVLVAGLRTGWLARLVAEADLPPGSQVTIFDRAGTVIARHPDAGPWLGQSAAGTEVLRSALESMGGGRTVRGLDGVERLYVGAALRSQGREVAYVTVGVPSAVAYAGSRRILVRDLGWLGAVILVTLAAAWWLGGRLLVRPARALARAARALGEGRLSSRTGLDDAPGELGQVARAFDLMAEDLARRERELREREATLRALIDGNSEPLLLLDPAGTVLAANEAAARSLGVSPAEMIGRNAAELLRPEAASLRAERFAEALRTRRPVRFEEAQDGRFLESFLQPILDDHGEVFQVAVLVIDVTERKRNEISLFRANRALRTLSAVQSSAAEAGDETVLFQRVCRDVVEQGGYRMAWVGLVEEDPDKTIRPVARAGSDEGYVDALRLTWGEGERGLGPTGTAVRTGRACATRDVAADPGFAPWRAAALRRGFGSVLALPLGAEDATVAVLTLYAPEPDAFDDEEVELLSGVAGSVSQSLEARRTRDALRHSQEQLVQAHRLEAVGRLAGGVAHDFNNILQIILGRGELLLEQLPPEETCREGLMDLLEAAGRAAGLTRQLLAFSRRQVLQPQLLDLNHLVSGFEKMIRRLISEDIIIEARLDPALEKTLADPGQMEQVLMNLVLNARDAMPTGGRLTVETRNVELDEGYARRHPGVIPGPHVMLAVSDTGGGMPPEIAAQLFEPFFTTKARGQGTGLGLATVYGIVKQSGGNIWVYSEPGRGSTFKVYLPRAEGAGAARPEANEGGAVALSDAPRGTLLVVEDEAQVRTAVVGGLRARGHTVYEAPSPFEAIELFEQVGGEVDLLLTDVVLPGMSGRELAERLQVLQPGLRVLLMSGYTENAIVHHGVLDAGLAFLQKPFTKEALARKVCDLLGSGAAGGGVSPPEGGA